MTDPEDIIKHATTIAECRKALDVAATFLDESRAIALTLDDGSGLFGSGIDLRSDALDVIDGHRAFVEGLRADQVLPFPQLLTFTRKAVRITWTTLQIVREADREAHRDLLDRFLGAVGSIVADVGKEALKPIINAAGDAAQDLAKQIKAALKELWPLGAVAGGALVLYVGFRLVRA